MILVDPRDGNPKETRASVELVKYIRGLGVSCDRSHLQYGDICFEGNGPEGRILIGIERKTLHDLLHSIDDGRYNQQRVGMAGKHGMYDISLLFVEGIYKRHEEGWLMEGFWRDGRINWGYCRYRQKPVMYSKMRFLISVALSGVLVVHTTSLYETAYEATEWFRYFEHKWEDHTSLLETQKLAIPAIDVHPPLVREWAARIDGIGVKRSADAQRLFKIPYRLANSDEMDWLRITGVGVATAQDIIRQIHGRERRK